MAGVSSNVKRSIQKLILAIQYRHGRRITYHTQQFVGREGNVHTLYMLKEATYDDSKGKYINHDVFKSASTIQIALFLRDMYYQLEGQELPTDNEIWNKIRERINENNG